MNRSILLFALFVSSLSSVTGCRSTTELRPEQHEAREIPCTDQDGDGYGAHCDAGPDCNDEDPGIYVGCSAAVGCTDEPDDRCPCSIVGERYECGKITIETEYGLVCGDARRTCGEDGLWTECHLYLAAGPGGASGN